MEVSFRVMPFNDFIAAIDQNILTLTQEFVEQVIAGLNSLLNELIPNFDLYSLRIG